jgi:acyl carrier protein
MKRNNIQEALIKALGEVQQLNGKPTPTITGTTQPIGDLAGYDSLIAVETASLVADYLGCNIDPKLMLPNNSNQNLTVDQITDRIVSSLTGEDADQGENNDQSRT